MITCGDDCYTLCDFCTHSTYTKGTAFRAGKHTCTKHLKPVKADEVCDDFECFLREKHMTEIPGYSPIIKYFAYEHLPERLQGVSKQIGDLARELDKTLPDGPEKTAGLRKLLEAKDCLVRASL